MCAFNQRSGITSTIMSEPKEMKAYLEGEVIRSTSRCTIDLDCTRFHGITDHDGLVNIPGKDAALRPTYPKTILLY